jgi:hypothetical protein
LLPQLQKGFTQRRIFVLILKEYGTSNFGTSPVMEKFFEKLKEERSGKETGEGGRQN